MHGTIFSLADLNKMLPLVKAIVRDIRREYAALREELVERGTPDGEFDSQELLRDLPWDLRDRIDEIRDWTRELLELGIFLRDPRTGLVEAYGERNGEIVFYSWRLGEDEVKFWHELTNTSGERLPVAAMAT